MELQKYIKIHFSSILPESTDLFLGEIHLLDPTGIEDAGMDEWIAYFEYSNFQENQIKNLAEKYGLQYSIEELIEENWNAQWESQFEPINIDDFCVIRADFHDKPKHIQYDLVITPKMSFGTGHHATTYQMIKEMQNLHFQGTKVLDFGTGTGVLGILAAKMGAEDVIAVDNDIWSIENAKENAETNAISWTLYEGSLEQVPEENFDIILANINLHILKAYAAKMYDKLKENGVLLVSGILDSDKNELSEILKAMHFREVRTTQKDKWLMMHWVK